MPFEVGQEVAIRSGYGYATYQLATVERVAPGGQIIVKTANGEERRFNADGILRGHSTTPIRLVELTPAIREQIRRKALLERLGRVNWSDLDTAVLERVTAALDAS